MSQFESFFDDFGLRCFDLFPDGKPVVYTGERDATRALCVLAAALTIPHERLRPANKSNGKPLDATVHSHHPAGDTIHYPAAATLYRDMLAKDFSATFGTVGGWYQGKLKIKWGEPFPSNSPDVPLKRTVGGVLTTIRNGLAHGSVQMFAPGAHIETVRFLGLEEQPECLAEVKRGDEHEVKYVAATLPALTELLRGWQAFLKSLQGSRKGGC